MKKIYSVFKLVGYRDPKEKLLWGSYYCSPNPHVFLGYAPPRRPVSMTQQKRLTTGLLEILFSKNNLIFVVLTGKLQFQRCLAYLWVLIWGLRSIPELFYAALPAYCIITNSNFLPIVSKLITNRG
ncbi:hypothetical protein Ddye_016726 [Dipteronia dyeriana]|uniref:Uncharacterized protein n=1 Tax=Dipteronia dyeriana TaxID=168575 RepID=A0AAD9U7E7_9ROSI|nr:hypothetical protein Ddye_016726 [Dipteronia dyeriana]